MQDHTLVHASHGQTEHAAFEERGETARLDLRYPNAVAEEFESFFVDASRLEMDGMSYGVAGVKGAEDFIERKADRVIGRGRQGGEGA